MEGERASNGYFSEALNFDHGSTSSNGGLDPWENIHSHGDNDLHAYMIANSETNTPLSNSVFCEQHVHRSSHGEASSSRKNNEAASGNEQRRIEIIDLDPLFEQPSGANQPVQNVNYIEIPDDPVSDRSGFFEANGQGARASQPGRPFENNSVRLGSSVDGRRASRKRKALEAGIGQSSSGGYRDFQHGESSSRTPASTVYRPENGVNTPVSLELAPRGLVSGNVSNSHVSSIAESSSSRSNPSEQQETVNPPGSSVRTVFRRPVTPSQSNSSRLLPEEQHLLDFQHEQSLDNIFSWNPNAPALSLPPVSENILTPFQWLEGSLGSGSSNSTAPVERSRSLSGNILENLLSPSPQIRSLARRQIRRNATSGNLNSAPSLSRTGSTAAGQPPSLSRTGSTAAGQPLSTSRTGSTTGGQPPSMPRTASTTAAQPPSTNLASNHYRISYHGRRVAHRSFPGTRPTLHSLAPPASPDEILLQPGGNNTQMHNPAYPRAGLSLDTQGGNVSRIPHSLRAILTGSRARNRLTSSQMQNVLDAMHRNTNTNLRPLEEVMLRHAMLFQAAGSHDRYRDMRLDVDNMSYEELVALGERIGDVCTGITEETISTGLKQRKYKSGKRPLQDTDPCCICLEEYSEGEEIGTLECGHEFHSQCIKEWLKQKNLCPFCKETGLNNTNKKKKRKIAS